MAEKNYPSAKKMLKELSRINNTRLYNDEINLFIKEVYEKIL